MPRLLCCCAVDEPGGAEVVVVRLLAELERRGWTPVLTSPAAHGELARVARRRGWAHAALDPGGLARGGGRAAAPRAFPRALRLAGAADAVVVNGTTTARLLPALAAARRPTVLYVHDVVDRVPPHWRLATAVAAASGAVARRLDPPLRRTTTTYAAVDLDPPPATAPWALDPARPVVGFVGRIEPRKGVHDLVAAAPLIRAARPDARVVVVGGDPYGSDAAYLGRITGSPEVEHHGWAANAPGLMRHLDVLVLPSHREPFGTVLSEAMAVGTPVVATAVDGLPEVVTDGVDGVLVPPGDPRALAAGVVRALAERDVLAANAVRAARRFAPGAVADRFEPLLRGHTEPG